VPQLIAETQRELGVQFDEIISMLVDLESSGAIRIVGIPDTHETTI
jgi:hypothetical protein